jgi:nucleoside triphosphate pyrophosphatase
MIEIPAGVRLVVASASPRRSELLRSVGLDFDVIPAEIDESVLPGELPADYVARLSVEKASVVAERVGPDAIVVAADTTVDVDGQILEKPVDDADARRMLRLLSGRVHLVHTAVTVLTTGLSFRVGSDETGAGTGARTVSTVVVETAVEFDPMTPQVVDWYVGTGEPFGKAGGYAIQGAGGAFVRRLDGSVTNVIGLPLAETLALIARHPNL